MRLGNVLEHQLDSLGFGDRGLSVSVIQLYNIKA